MDYKVETTANFQKEAKKLLKKYRSLKEELADLIDELEKNPEKGIHTGNDVYKIRLAVKSKGTGKSGGMRVMTKIKIVDEKVYMFSIYSKGEQDNISDKKIHELVKLIDL